MNIVSHPPQVHLNHKGGVQANAVGGHLLPEDQGGIDEEFFKSDQEKAAEASSAQAATPVRPARVKWTNIRVDNPECCWSIRNPLAS